jgi:outer membrane protein TolC
MPAPAWGLTTGGRESLRALLFSVGSVLCVLLLGASCASKDPVPPEHAAVTARYENRPAPAAEAKTQPAPISLAVPAAPKTTTTQDDAPAQPPANLSLQAPAQADGALSASNLRLRDIPPAKTPGSLPLGTLFRPVPSGEVPNAPAGDPSAAQRAQAPGAMPPAASGDTPVPPPDPASGAPLTLSDCVRLAVEHSPYLKGPALEVEIRKLDEKDAWYKLFPSLNFIVANDRFISGEETRTRKIGDTYNNLGLSSGTYNPIAAWVQHDAQKDVTKLAKMGQILALQELILQMANAFVALDNLDRQIAARKELIDLADKGLIYATRLENVQTTGIDVRIAQQRLALAHAEYEFLLASRLQVVMGLKDIIGLPAYNQVNLDVEQFKNVVLPLYKVENYDLNYAQANNIKMQMQKLRTELAKLDVKAQWVRFMPTLSFILRKPDQVNANTSANLDNYYLTTTLNFPLWQWGESVRAVDKAELRQEETDAGNEIERLKFHSSWTMQKLQVQQQARLLELAEAEVILADLNRQKGESEYGSGRITGRQFLDLKTNVILARIKANDQLKNYQTALLQMVSDTGDLMKRFVNIEDVGHE